MDTVPETIVTRSLMHATYVEDIGGGRDGVVVSEIIENDRGEIRPNLRKYRSPEVPFWITQVPYRTHTDKKEFESVKFLDEYRVKYKDKDKEIFKVLNGYYPHFLSPPMRREIYQNPYLYGGNIDIVSLVAQKYKKDLLAAGKTPHTPTTGFLDIEQSLLPSTYGQLPLIVYTHENKVFLAMGKWFMQEERNGVMVDVTVEDVRRGAHEIIDPLVASLMEENKDLADAKHKVPFTYEFYVGETQIDMIKWIFDKAHECQTSFIGIWNLGYDIGEITKILNEARIDLTEVFSHPSLRGTGYAKANYREDNRKVAHWTQKWHWLTATAHFQFIDSMALFSHIRMVDGKQPSYKLNDILKNFGLGGKLKIEQTEELEGLQEGDWHRAMLSKYFRNYALYAMWDGMSLQMLEWINNDLTTMRLQVDITSPRFFVNQTIRATNILYEKFLPQGWILGTGVDVEGMRDHDLPNAGGAVLEPQNLIPRGLCLFEEWPNHKTNCYAWESDLDFSAQYPTAAMVMNISKQTMLATALNIKSEWVQQYYNPKDAVEVFSSYIITPNCNGVELGVEFFNLPDYDTMEQLFAERMTHV